MIYEDGPHTLLTIENSTIDVELALTLPQAEMLAERLLESVRNLEGREEEAAEARALLFGD
jgi:hypothetical protein